MEIVFNTKTIPICREVCRQTKLIQERGECVVSDSKEDVGKIAWAEAQLCLKGKELGARCVSVDASADISVFYLTEDRMKLECMNFRKDLSIEFECEEIDPGAELQIRLNCLGVQARPVNPRKLNAELNIRAEMICYAREEMICSLTAGEEQKGLYLLREQRECENRYQVCEKSFVVSEQIPLAREDVRDILSSRAALFFNDCQMIGGKALIKGGAELHFCFETDTGAGPCFLEECLPFSVLIDSGAEEGELGGMILQPTALYASLSDAINGGRLIELEMHAVAQASFVRKEKLDYIVDAFSTRCPLACTEKTVTVELGHHEIELESEVRDSIAVDTQDAEVLASHAELLSCAANEGTASASAAVSLLLREPDGSYAALQKYMSFESELPAADYRIFDARLLSLTASPSGKELRLLASVCFCCEAAEQEELSYLPSVEIDEDNAFDLKRTPMLRAVKRRGRELWSLAKAYHSSPEAIEALNEKYPMQGDLLLIPRL